MNCCINSRLVDSCSGYTILILDYIVFRRLESVPNARKKIIENFLPKFFTCHFFRRRRVYFHIFRRLRGNFHFLCAITIFVKKFVTRCTRSPTFFCFFFLFCAKFFGVFLVVPVLYTVALISRKFLRKSTANCRVEGQSMKSNPMRKKNRRNMYTCSLKKVFMVYSITFCTPSFFVFFPQFYSCFIFILLACANVCF